MNILDDSILETRDEIAGYLGRLENNKIKHQLLKDHLSAARRDLKDLEDLKKDKQIFEGIAMKGNSMGIANVRNREELDGE